MWAHYADNHFGVCYEFDVNEIFDKSLYRFGPITYSNSLPKLHCFVGETTESHLNPQIDQIILCKSSSWSYEQEFRFYTSTEPDKHQYNPMALKTIILGIRTSQEELIKAIKLVKSFNEVHGTNVTVKYAQMSKRNFEIEVLERPSSSLSVTCPLYEPDSSVLVEKSI